MGGGTGIHTLRDIQAFHEAARSQESLLVHFLRAQFHANPYNLAMNLYRINLIVNVLCLPENKFVHRAQTVILPNKGMKILEADDATSPKSSKSRINSEHT